MLALSPHHPTARHPITVRFDCFIESSRSFSWQYYSFPDIVCLGTLLQLAAFGAAQHAARRILRARTSEIGGDAADIRADPLGACTKCATDVQRAASIEMGVKEGA